jgi:hypothetical protein
MSCFSPAGLAISGTGTRHAERLSESPFEAVSERKAIESMFTRTEPATLAMPLLVAAAKGKGAFRQGYLQMSMAGVGYQANIATAPLLERDVPEADPVSVRAKFGAVDEPYTGENAQFRGGYRDHEY